jgi:uncharacterized protein (UPF0332 family)
MLEVVHYSDEAARAAYLAALQAAQALIWERTGKVVKTHRGVRSSFGRLAREEPAIGPNFTEFLANSFKFKQIADYDTDPEAVVASAEAQEAIETATRFVDCIATLLG